MFSSFERLKRKTTSKDLNRSDYLQALVTEFQETQDNSAKEQVLANLANFAYDPINYQYLRDLRVIDLFIDCIDIDEDVNGSIVEYGIGGLCNLAPEPENRQLILDHPASIENAIRCLSSSVEETVLSAITLLMQLVIPDSRSRIVTTAVVECMQNFATMQNARYRNLAIIFLEDYCSAEERALATQGTSGQYLYIPVPKK
ncbi:unnamed protein product [Clavelina lepadiformis]|uniref:Armadillo repeat-containing protein 7 n=1 Tax=Clavelina lepadiformis TaxID=159417 RepID=A0ABP0GHH6_CLALP